MFGLSLASQLFQGSTERTWNCVSHFAHLLWLKVHHLTNPIMPRSRKRHHSRSRSRSRSHSHDRPREDKPKRESSHDRDAGKRRKIESCDSPHKRSVSAEASSSPSVSPAPQLKKLEEITPKKVLSPKQLQKKLESEKKRKERQEEREEKERKRQEEKQERLLQKQKQLEQKQKEREEKDELKRREKEEKRKEKELRKQQELDEKTKEKQKLEEKTKKASKAFVNFFVPKKAESQSCLQVNCKNFMPFVLKSDMKLAPARRAPLTVQQKDDFLVGGSDEEKTYLIELKEGHVPRSSPKTWPFEEQSDEVTIIEDWGETICEDTTSKVRVRAKFLKFHENRRPAFYGTWRKLSKVVTARRPFAEDSKYFDYEVESDDDWEDIEQGESLNGSDDEDKENEVEDDYEVDNEFFVPHGHLSDDEMDDEQMARLSPESLKQKLKLLKDEFDQDMQSKTHKIKPRSIGCIWYNKSGQNVDPAIDRYLQPLAVVAEGRILIGDRSFGADILTDLLVPFLKFIHGKKNKKKVLINEFLTEEMGAESNLSAKVLMKALKEGASWRKCLEEGPLKNVQCWLVNEDVRNKFGIEF